MKNFPFFYHHQLSIYSIYHFTFFYLFSIIYQLLFHPCPIDYVPISFPPPHLIFSSSSPYLLFLPRPSDDGPCPNHRHPVDGVVRLFVHGMQDAFFALVDDSCAEKLSDNCTSFSEVNQ